ncbi:MAG: WYL domain-containing protein [Aestuariibacter sp.]
MQEELQDLSHSARERLAFIDFSLQYFGHIARNDLIARFKTGLAACTRDFATYKELAPKNMQLNHQDKRYYRQNEFRPLFEHEPEAILHGLCRGFGNGISEQVLSSDVCQDAVRLIHPKPAIIAALMRAIHNKQAIDCHYVSLSSGETTKTLVPHSIVNNGHRWHVRAFDRAHQQFRDFVCTRFTGISVNSENAEAHEYRDADSQWNRIVDLVLIPHPDIKQSTAIELDYDMHDGQLVLQVRAALASYLLRQWQVDCSKDHRIKGQGCQLALANHSELGDVENIHLAPGFK